MTTVINATIKHMLLTDEFTNPFQFNMEVSHLVAANSIQTCRWLMLMTSVVREETMNQKDVREIL